MSPNEGGVSRRSALKTLGAAAGSVAVVPGAVTASPESEYESTIDSLMADYDIKGLSTAVVPTDGSSNVTPVYQNAFGINKIHGSSSYRRYREPLDTSHRLRLASVAKTLTSTAILQMVDVGYFDLDDPVFGSDGVLSPSEWGDPDPNCEIQVQHLLNHQFVIQEETNDDSWSRVVYHEDLSNDWGLKEVVQYVNDNFTVTLPHFDFYGDTFCYPADEYYNYGYGVLGAIVEQFYGGSGFTNGIAFETYLRNHVLDPFGAGGMDRVDTEQGAVDNEGYHHSDDRDPYADWITRERAWAWAAWAGTPLEVARFGQSVAAGQQISSSLVGDYEDLADYGWGSYDSGNYVGHNGGQAGVLAALRANSERTFCVLINTRHSDTWDDEGVDPRDDIVDATRTLAEDLL